MTTHTRISGSFFNVVLTMPQAVLCVITIIGFSIHAKAQAPTIGATSFSVTDIRGDVMDVNWVRGNGSRVLVIASENSAFNGTGTPADGVDYVPNNTFGSGSLVGAGNYVVYEGTGDDIDVRGLVHSTTYYFRIYEFNGTGPTTQYNTVAVLSGSGTTLSPPTTGSSNMVATPTGNSASLAWTAGNGTRRLVILQVGSAPGDPTQYVNYNASTSFGSGTAIGSGRVVYFDIASSVNITNLEPNTTYFYKVVEANGTGNSVFNLATALVGSFTTGGAPTTGATTLSVSNILGNSLRINWARGNGSNVLVIASLSPTFGGTGEPANGTDYVENAAFGSGDQIGAGNFVVYRNTGTNVTVSNLVHSTTYYFRIYEFNGTNFNTVYNTSAVLSGSGTTLFPPTNPSTNLIATPTGNTASLTWTRGNGNRCLVILQTGSTPGDPTQYQNYSASPAFGSGSAIGTGRVVYFSTGNSVTVTNLQPNTTYFYKVVESNGTTGSGSVYNVTNTLTGSFTTAGAPTAGSTSFNASSIEGDRFSFSFTRGNGTERLVVARQDLPVEWVPTDGVDYNPSSTFGSGDNLGNNTFAISQTTGSNVSITGLTPATTYHIAVFEYNGTGTNTVYLTTPSQVLTGSATTLSPPSTSAGNLAFSSITGYGASFTFSAGNGARRLILARAGSPVTDVPVNLVNYSSNVNFVSAPTLGSSKIVYDGAGLNSTITALQPNTTYHFAIFEYNGSTSPVYKQVDPGIGSFTTLGKPTVAPTTATFNSTQGDRMTINYTTGNGFGRIVIAKQGSPVDAFPADFTSYTASSVFGSGAHLGGGNYVIQNNTAVNGTSGTGITGLAIGQTYHFAVIEYNGTGTERIYMSSTEALTANHSTLSAPTVQASNVTFTNITANSMTINWQNGNGDARLVLIRAGSAVATLPSNLVNYSASSSYPSSTALGTSRIVYEGSGNSVTVTNVPPGEYHVAVIEFNGSSQPVYRTSDPLIGAVNVGAKPTIPATNLRFSNIDGNRISVACDPGDGLSRMLIVKAGSPVNAWPVDFTGYTASGTFGSGSDLGGGNFVCAISPATSFTVANLLPGTTYYFAIVELNGSGATAFYQDQTLITQASSSTLSAPSIHTSSVAANNIIGNSMQLTWTRGNGTGRVIIAKAGSAVDVEPTQLVDLDGDVNFGSGTNLGNGNFAVYDGAGDNVTLQNLQPGTTYHFAFFEFNGSLGKVYLTGSPTRASFTTAPRPSIAASSLNVSVVEGDRFNITFTRGNGTRRLIVVRQDEFVDAIPTDLTTYTGGAFGAGSQIGTGNFVTHITSGTTNNVTITGLQPNTNYGVAVFELDGINGGERYMTSAYINRLVKTASAPTAAPSALLYNSIGSTSVNLSWTNGNGAGRMIVLLPSQPVTFVPTTLSTHGTASSNFTSTANNLPASHKQMFRGAGTTVTFTNLSPGVTYHVAFYEYNGSGQPVYNTNPLRGYFTTLPTSGVAIGGFDAITFCPSQQVDVPYISANLLNPGNQMSVELSDITGSFASPIVLGTQSTTNTSGFITSILPASLPEGTGYRLRVRASNPNLVSADNGSNLQITTSVQPTFSVVGGQPSSCGTPIELNTTQTGYNLQWFRNGVAIPGATSNTHFATLTGDYQVRIAGASGGCQLFSAATTLTISQRPTFNLNLNPAYCEDQVVDIASGASPAGGTFSGAGVSSGTFDASLAGTGQHLLTYQYVDAVSSCTYTEDAVVVVAEKPAAPVTIGAIACAPASVILQATGASPSQNYAWYTDPTGGTAIAGEITGNYAPSTLTSSQTYYAVITDGVCESPRTAVTAQVNTPPAAPAGTDASSCVSASLALMASGAADGQYQWYTDASGATAISGEVNAVFNTPVISTTTTYYVTINDGTCESSRTAVTAAISTVPNAPTVTSASTCTAGSIVLTASGGNDGEYRWYTDASGGTPLSGEVNNAFTTPTLTTTTSYYVAINDGTCESARTQVTATINNAPNAPTTTSASSCGPASVTLAAAGGSNGQYRWYSDATSTTPLSGEVNSTLTTPVITTTTTYYVAISNTTCESNRQPVIATINAIPAKPTINTSIPANASNTITLCNEVVVLSAPAGFSYNWSNGLTTQQIEVSQSGTYSVVLVSAENCSSVSSDAINVVALTNCGNSPPAIEQTTLITTVEGTVGIDLLTLITDADNNLDLSSLRILVQPISGAVASISSSYVLTIDYRGVNFSGQDRLTIEVCDQLGVCTQQEIVIDVAGDIVVYNAVSPNGDGKNDHFIIQYIDTFEDTRSNKVTIFSRWGDAVFETVNYNNTDNFFRGENKNGNPLPSGTYFYKIEFDSGRATRTGYLSLKR